MAKEGTPKKYRVVRYYEWVDQREDPNKPPGFDNRSVWVKQYADIAKFHGWGVSYEEFDTGPGNYTCAIIELKDGKVKLVDAELVEFVNYTLTDLCKACFDEGNAKTT